MNCKCTVCALALHKYHYLLYFTKRYMVTKFVNILHHLCVHHCNSFLLSIGLFPSLILLEAEFFCPIGTSTQYEYSFANKALLLHNFLINQFNTNELPHGQPNAFRCPEDLRVYLLCTERERKKYRTQDESPCLCLLLITSTLPSISLTYISCMCPFEAVFFCSFWASECK